jgi:hypothetical protein
MSHTSTTTESSVKILKDHLGKLPITAHFTVPYNETFDVQDFPEWSLYDFAFDDYMNIGNADCQVICNETPQSQGFINTSMAREILCGMLKQKSIVMLHAPVFDKDVDLFSQVLINSKLDKIYICDLLDLDTADARNFIHDISYKVINYSLNNHDVQQIKSRIRSHLHTLQDAMA